MTEFTVTGVAKEDHLALAAGFCHRASAGQCLHASRFRETLAINAELSQKGRRQEIPHFGKGAEDRIIRMLAEQIFQLSQGVLYGLDHAQQQASQQGRLILVNQDGLCRLASGCGSCRRAKQRDRALGLG